MTEILKKNILGSDVASFGTFILGENLKQDTSPEVIAFSSPIDFVSLRQKY